MGSFDDIPAATSGGSFDDLPDLIQAAPGKRKVGVGDAFGRAAMEGYAGTGNLLGMAGGGLATVLEGAFNLATGNDSTRLRDAVFENVVQPTRDAQKYWAIDPATEELDGGGAEAASVAGSLASLLQQAVAQPGSAAGAMVPKLLYPAMRAAPAVVQKIAPLAAEGAIKAQLPFAQPTALDRTQDLMDQGVDQNTAMSAGATNLVGNTVMGALPLAKAGGLLTRAGTGAALNVPTGIATRGAEAAVLGDEYAKQALPAMGDKEVGMDAGIGAVMAALFGPRAAGVRRAPTAEPAPAIDIDLAAQAADLEKYGPILQANGIDPTSQRAAGVIANLKAREARMAQPAEDTVPPSPEELALASKQQTPETIAVDSLGRADAGDTGIKAGMMSAEETRANVEADARQAFDLAARRQSQADADLAGRNEIAPDYQGDGAAARDGRFSGGVREVTLYGERPVTVMESGVGKRGDQTIIGYEGEDGQIYQQSVPTKDLKTFNVPENQRLAQDFIERSSTPPKGVGVETMAGEKMPRRSTDRIAGDEFGGKTTPYNSKLNDRGQVAGDMLPATEPGSGGNGTPVPRAGRVIDGESTTNQARLSAPAVAESQVQAPKSSNDGVASDQGAAPAEPRQRPTGPLRTKEPESLLQAIKRLGGISVKQLKAMGLTERDYGAARSRIGKNTGGKDLSLMAEYLSNDGYALNGRDMVEKAQHLEQLIFDELAGNKTYADVDAAQRFASESEVYNRAQQLGIDPRRRHFTDVEAEVIAREKAMNDADEFDAGEQMQAKVAEAETALGQERIDQLSDEVADSMPDAPIADIYRAIVKRLEDEINANKEYQQAAEVSRAAGGAEDGAGLYAAEVRADAADRAPAGDESGRDGFELEQPTPDGLRAADEQRVAADKAQADAETAAEAKAKADAEVSDYKLTGSDRKADANPDQGDLLSGAKRGAEPPQDAKPADPDSEAEQMRRMFGDGPVDLLSVTSTKALVKAVRDTFGFSFGDAKAWSDHLHGFQKDMEAIRSGASNALVNPAGRMARFLFDTSAGAIRAKANANKSETFQWVLDQFHTEGGASRVAGETYEAAVSSQANKFLNRLQSAIGDLHTDDVAMRQIANRVRSRSFDGTPAGKAAKEIAGLMKDALDYMRKAGVDIGEIKDGYYPREFDVAAILKNPAGFKLAIEAEYAKTMPASEAKLAAEHLHDTLLFGDMSSLFNSSGGAVRTPFAKERVFGKIADKTLEKFLLSDPTENITVYLQRAVRRAELSSRFGDKMSHWANEWTDAKGKKQESILSQLQKQGATKDIEALKDYVALAAGLRHNGSSAGVIRAAGIARTWGALTFLSHAAMSSLSEFVTPAIRASGASKNPVALIPDATRALHQTLSDLFLKARSASAAERRAFAEDLGMIAAAHSDSIVASRWSGGEPTSKIESRIMHNFFQRIGLTQWTESTRVASADMGRVFVRRLSKNIADGDKLSVRYLKELGVPEAQVKEFAAWVSSQNDGMPSAGNLSGKHADLYRVAIRRFVSQSIMEPGKTTKPAWMSHPIGAVVGQLQSFNYAFYENVWKRNMKMAGEAVTGRGEGGEQWSRLDRARLAYPLLSMPALVGVAFAIGELRDEVFGDKKKRAEETTGQKLLKAASRGVPIAPIDPVLNYFTAVKYQRGAAESFAGPVIGKMATTADAARNALLNNNPKTNTAERQIAKNTYDLFIEPSIQLALSVSPMSPFSVIATQAAAAGSTRSTFVDAVAGKDKRKKDATRR